MLGGWLREGRYEPQRLELAGRARGAPGLEAGWHVAQPSRGPHSWEAPDAAARGRACAGRQGDQRRQERRARVEHREGRWARRRADGGQPGAGAQQRVLPGAGGRLLDEGQRRSGMSWAVRAQGKKQSMTHHQGVGARQGAARAWGRRERGPGRARSDFGEQVRLSIVERD